MPKHGLGDEHAEPEAVVVEPILALLGQLDPPLQIHLRDVGVLDPCDRPSIVRRLEESGEEDELVCGDLMRTLFVPQVVLEVGIVLIRVRHPEPARIPLRFTGFRLRERRRP